MNLIVCGSRTWRNADLLFREMDHYTSRLHHDSLLILNGNCPTGADKIARDWCKFWVVPCRLFDADWDRHGKAAGPLRNGLMVAEAGGLIAFRSSGKSSGTDDCIRQAKSKGIRCVVITEG